MSTATAAVATRAARAEAAPMRPSVNDLAIRVGTVNGSGSQSANLVLLRALHLMGIPCSGKNVFPSNIEGLPTWFHIRASRRGYVGHRLNPQVLVCMNERTAVDDLEAMRAGAVCFYRDDFKEADLADLRSDVQAFEVPFVALLKDAYPPDKSDKGHAEKSRKVINMIYVGVVASACGIELEAVREAIRLQFPGRKAKAAAINIAAAEAGHAWAAENLPADLPFQVERMDATRGTILIEGNEAAALGAVFGGVSVLTWYPITPSSSLAEAAEGFLKQLRRDPDGSATYSVVQAEDELAAIGIAVGAGWAGARAMTATSGPGISLMGEFVGLAYFAEIPVAIVDVQRMGPSTGLPTRTSQGDLGKLHLVGHGDCRHPVLIPSSPSECFEFVAEAIDLAQEFQTPIFVALDLDLGMNLWMSERFRAPEGPLKRGKVLNAEDLERLGGFGRYRDVDGDGVCYRTIPGTEHPQAAYFTRGTGHDEESGYSERPDHWRNNLDRLARKLQTARTRLPAPEIDEAGHPVGLIACGSTHWALVEARDHLGGRNVPTDYCRLRALPIADEAVEFVRRHERCYVVEQNRDGQVYNLLRAALPPELVDRIISITHYDGTPLAAANVREPILERERPIAASGMDLHPDHAEGANIE